MITKTGCVTQYNMTLYKNLVNVEDPMPYPARSLPKLQENLVLVATPYTLMFGELGALGGIILHGHAEWIETRDLTFRNFDSRLRIKVMAY